MSDFEAVVRWYLVLALAGAAGYPIATLLLGEFRQRAAWFARSIGMLSVLLPTWFLSSTVDLPYTTTGLWATLLVVAAIGWFWIARNRWLDREAVQNLLVAEIVTLLVFLGALWLRGFTPDILNTEKPMDSAFLSATMRTDQMPPADPWLAGETINYYYVGYALHGAIARMAGVESPVAFNLALITTTAITVAAVIGAALIALPRWGRYAAPLAAFLVVVAGNMDGPYRVLRNGRAAWEAGWWDGMGWNSSRVVHDGDIETINEFPAFSIILGDLHPHLMALPFTIVALAVAIAFVRQPRILGRDQLLLAGVLGGSLYALNSWDLPTYFGLILLAALWNLRGAGGRQIALRIGAMLLAALVAWAPFLLTFTPFIAGSSESVPDALQGIPIVETLLTTVSGNHFEFTSAGEFLRVFGLPYALILIALAFAASRLPESITDSRNGTRLGVPAAILVLIAILANAPVFILVGLPVMVTVWVIARAGVSSAEGIVAALFLAGSLIVILTELFYIEDAFHNRMNTLFKAYYQVWTLWGIGAAVGIVWVLVESRRIEWRAVAGAMVASAVVLGLIYPVNAAGSWVELFDEWYGGEWQSLTGSEFVANLYPDELAGIEFIREHAESESVVLEAPGCAYRPFGELMTSRVSAFTGVPTVIGWLNHEGQWRSGDQGLLDLLDNRRAEVQEFYFTPTQEFLDRYNIDFVYYGVLEARSTGIPQCSWWQQLPRPSDSWMSEHGFEVVFQQGDVTIWQRQA